MSHILIISPEPWRGHFVSKHHYALELARRGHSVLFHGPPEPGPMRIEPVEVDLPQTLQILHAPKVAPVLRHMPARFRRRLETRWLQAVERLTEVRFDIVWLFENSRFYDMRFAEDRLKIYHQVDLNQDFHPETAAATADLTIAISGPIEARINTAARALLRITHGCAVAQFDMAEALGTSDRADKVATAFTEFPANAVLTGNLEIPYLDLDLLCDLVRRYPTTGFHFVGGYTAGHGLHKMLAGAENAVFWGQQPAQTLPLYLRRADILLVAYRAQAHLEQLANPHKIMEYLAAGACVLASQTLEYDARPDLVVTADDAADFLDRFANMLGNLEHLNNREQIARRRAFAADNTYPRQLERIASALGAQGNLIS